MRRRGAKKLIVFMCIIGCHSCRAALRLWWPSFSPDWPSAVNFFLLLFFIIFPLLLFLFFLFLFVLFVYCLLLISCFILLLFLLFRPLLRLLVVSVALLRDWLRIGDVFVVCSVSTSPHLQALRVFSIAVVPCPGFWCFPYFSI